MGSAKRLLRFRFNIQVAVKYFLEILISVALVHFHHTLHDTSEVKINRPNHGVNHSSLNQVEPSLTPAAESYTAVRGNLAKELKDKVRILCWIMTVPKNHWLKARHVKRTWGKRCNILLFMSSEADDRIPTVKLPGVIEGYNYVWTKTREAYRYVWENYKDQADWFLKADDDSYIVLENLRYLLSAYNTSEPLYFGHKYRAYIEKGYMQGGSGYVLSREATKRFVEIGLKDEKLCPPQSWAEDVQICDCLAKLGCDGVDTRDAHGRDRFFPEEFKYHVAVGVSFNYFDWYGGISGTFQGHPSFYPVGKNFNCCSDTTIGFHKVSPESMYLYDYLIYRLNPYGIENIRHEMQSMPSPPPDAQLKERPFSGHTTDDLKWVEAMLKRDEEEMKKVSIKEEEAKLLDANETVRNANLKKESVEKISATNVYPS